MIELLFGFIILLMVVVIGVLIYDRREMEDISRSKHVYKIAADELQSIIYSSTKKGHLGESIVRHVLSTLPSDKVHEQFTHPDIPGRPDFAIEIDGRYLIIDAKFSTREKSKYLAKRGLGIAKYVSPEVTYPIVLMWIPEPAFEDMDPDDFKEMYSQGVIACNTSGLVSCIHMVMYTNRILGIRNSDEETIENKFAAIKVIMENGQAYLDKAQTQMSNAHNNILNAKNEFTRINTD